tara:strand:+ start:1761 stop:2165 length:405 start_codon:yes stop_codon:yes gene_type:complete
MAINKVALILVKKISSKKLSVISISTRNIDYNTIIIKKEKENAHFKLDKERLQVKISQSPAASGSMQPIIIKDSNVGSSAQPIVVDRSNDKQIDKVPDYICDIMRGDVLNKNIKSKYNNNNNDSDSPQHFPRLS